MKHAVITAASLSLALVLALSEGDFGECQSLIQQGAYPDVRDEKGNWLLRKVVSVPKHVKFACMLLKAGASVNRTNAFRETPLFAASRSGNLSYVKLLLKHRADPNIRNRMGVTAVMQAPDEGHVYVVKALVDAGGDVNMADNRGETALMASAFMVSREVVDTLLAAGACPLAVTPCTWTALTSAQEGGHEDVADTLRMACEASEEVASSLVFPSGEALPLVA